MQITKSMLMREALLVPIHTEATVQKLRGAFSATPIEKLNVRPIFNPVLARKMARLHRLQRKGLTPPGDKASLRAAADLAAATHPIVRCQTSQAAPFPKACLEQTSHKPTQSPSIPGSGVS